LRLVFATIEKQNRNQNQSQRPNPFGQVQRMAAERLLKAHWPDSGAEFILRMFQKSRGGNYFECFKGII
jgi:hypothetical protein